MLPDWLLFWTPVHFHIFTEDIIVGRDGQTSWVPLLGWGLASTCRNEGKEAVTSLAKEPSLRFLANGGVYYSLFGHGFGGACPPACCPWVLQHPTSPHLPRGAKDILLDRQQHQSWAHTSHLCDHLGQMYASTEQTKSESGSPPTVTTF